MKGQTGRLVLSTTWTVFAATVTIVSAACSSSSIQHNPRQTMLPTKLRSYEPPAWCQGRLLNIPRHRLSLANLPTPLYQIIFPPSSSLSSIFGGRTFPQQQEIRAQQPLQEQNASSGLGLRLLIKRDDATGGVELGGNKLRKLEFLLADALQRQRDSVVTIGGLQSNHCRATAAAGRMVGMEPHLILRTSIAAAAGETTTSPTPAAVGDSSVNDAAAAGAATPTIVNIVGDDLGTVGNLLVDRAVGATLYTCTPGEYGRVGSDVLVNRLCQHLNSKGRNSYGIPVGGSNGLGSWGYIQGVDELVQQLQQADEALSVDHVVFASGSGGTAAGIAIGLALAYGGGVSTSDGSARRKRPQVHAVGVCDSPDYFYGQVAKIAAEMGLVVLQDRTLDDFVREHLTVHQGKGLGYAVSTPDELAFVASFARDTGVLLDPVYSGKALYQFVQLVKQDPESYRDQTILFWHTGGTLGLYDKVDDASFLDRLKAGSPCHRLDVYGKGIGVDASRDVG